MRRLYLRISPFFLIVYVLCAAFAEGGEITIVYSANSSGKLRECGCPGDPYGGLSERVTLIRKLRKKEKPFLLVDAGNMVSLYGDYELKTSTIARIMNIMGYDAAGVGRLEMYHGIENVLAMAEKADFPLLSASIVRKDSLDTVFRPFEIISAKGQPVGIISVADSTCFILNRSKEPDFDLLPLEQSLKPAIDKLAKSVQFIVVLSHMATEANKQLLRDFPQIDLVIQGYGNERLKKPVQPSRGFLVAPGARGQFVGLITLVKNDGNNLEVRRAELIPVLDVEEDSKTAELVSYYYKNMTIRVK